MPKLIKEGHVYLAKPPLYKLEKNKKKAVIMALISALAYILSSLAFSTFSIFPRSGRIAWVARDRTHLQGFRNALTKTFNDYARSAKLLKDSEPNLSGEDIREGLTAIISVKIEDPQFEGQTKQKSYKGALLLFR